MSEFGSGAVVEAGTDTLAAAVKHISGGECVEGRVEVRVVRIDAIEIIGDDNFTYDAITRRATMCKTLRTYVTERVEPVREG
jgi:hypothetical protein